MPTLLAAAAASLALCATLRRPEFSLAAAVALIWVASAPLAATERRTRGGQAALTGACALPPVALAVSADHAVGGAWSASLAVALVGLAWSAALGAAAAGPRTRWRVAWLIASLAGPGVVAALALGGDGARWAWAEFAARLSALDWLARRLTHGALHDPSSLEFWAGLVAPSAALLACAWLSRSTAEGRP